MRSLCYLPLRGTVASAIAAATALAEFMVVFGCCGSGGRTGEGGCNRARRDGDGGADPQCQRGAEEHCDNRVCEPKYTLDGSTPGRYAIPHHAEEMAPSSVVMKAIRRRSRPVNAAIARRTTGQTRQTFPRSPVARGDG